MKEKIDRAEVIIGILYAHFHDVYDELMIHGEFHELMDGNTLRSLKAWEKENDCDITSLALDRRYREFIYRLMTVFGNNG